MANSRLKPKPITGFGRAAEPVEEPAAAPAPEPVTEPAAPSVPSAAVASKHEEPAEQDSPAEAPAPEEATVTAAAVPVAPAVEEPPAEQAAATAVPEPAPVPTPAPAQADPPLQERPPVAEEHPAIEEPPAEQTNATDVHVPAPAPETVPTPAPAQADPPLQERPPVAEEHPAVTASAHELGSAGHEHAEDYEQEKPELEREVAERPRARPVSRGAVSRMPSARAILELPRTPASASSGVTLGHAGRAVAASYLLASEGDERWAKFSIRLPEDLHRRSVRAMNRLRKMLRRRGLGTNHVWNAALAVMTPADLDVCVEWARARRQASDGIEAPSRSTTVHPAVKEAMTDLEGDLREHARHGLVGYLIAEIISRFLDRLEAELPDANS
ncbi:hypothetical protein AB0B54_30465 [Microbispora bryophytorum]|uniref:hypothetical protein n=1 Tax=Microbispora bryophytorum TaxID=1460882 RepID=UPI0033C6487C